LMESPKQCGTTMRLKRRIKRQFRLPPKNSAIQYSVLAYKAQRRLSSAIMHDLNFCQLPNTLRKNERASFQGKMPFVALFARITLALSFLLFPPVSGLASLNRDRHHLYHYGVSYQLRPSLVRHRSDRLPTGNLLEV
jgi:hypothetical protein